MDPLRRSVCIKGPENNVPRVFVAAVCSVCGCSLPAAAEVIPPFQHTKCLQDPLRPRTLHPQPQQQTVTLRLHSFECTPPSHQQGPEDTAAPLRLAVGAPMRCTAVPGSSSGYGSSSRSSGAQHMSFCVLTWEPLPGAVGRTSAAGSAVQLEFPAWVSSDQQEPSNVSEHSSATGCGQCMAAVFSVSLVPCDCSASICKLTHVSQLVCSALGVGACCMEASAHT